MDHDSLAARGRALEDDYFRQKDRELVRKLRQALTDAETLRELHDLGFIPETLSLLPLVPAIQLASGQSGAVAAGRQLLTTVARARGIAADTPADRQLSEWLATPPDDVTFARAYRLIEALLDTGGSGASISDDVVAAADQIGQASAGIQGLKPVSSEERAVLVELASAIRGR